MSGWPRLARLRALALLALGWTGLGWLGGDILSGGPGAAGPHGAAPSMEIAALVRAADGPPAAGAQTAIAAAETAARQALRDSPLDTSALALLGLAAAARDDPERAEELMELAAGRAPADLMARGWLFQRSILAGDVSRALAHADAMLRARPDLLDKLLPALAAIAADPKGRPALAGLLAGEPPWRGRFLERLARESADPLAPYGLYAALMTESSPPVPAELRPYLARLIEAGLYEQARLLWTQALPAERLADVGYVANGGFEEEPAGYIFDWSLEPVAGARAEIATIPESDGHRALRIQFLDRKVAFRHVRQLLMLMPGRYRLTGRVKAEGLENPRGLHWTLTCADEPETQLGASERVSGTTRWQGLEAVFEVPASGCPAQWLRLELAARIAAESHAAGAAWYDELAVSRLEDEEACADEESAPKLAELPGQALSAAADADATEVLSVAADAETGEAEDEEAAQCTCRAPAGTPAELVEVNGDVVVFRDEKGFFAGRRVALIAGDRVMVRAGGRAVLVQGMCRFELKPQSVVTLREENCTLCAAVVTTGEANVAYGQGAGDGAAIVSGGEANVAYGQSAGGGGFIGSPTLTPAVSPGLSLPSGIVLRLPLGETRPPASQ